MAEGGGGKCKKYVVPSSAEDCPCHPPVASVLCWNGRGPVSKVPQLMAYQVTIIKCSRDFEGSAWAQYDWAYRRQAAQTKDLRWSRLNLTLFSLCFAGKARQNIPTA